MGSANLVERLVGRQLALGRGERVAYLDPDGQLSYAELYRAVRWYAARLAGAGIRPGVRGLIVADDAIPTVVAILALWWRGAVAVPVSPMLTEAELAFIAEDCQAGFLHADERGGELATRAGLAGLPRGDAGWSEHGSPPAPPPVNQDPSEVLLIQYTSGSTGKPKGVLHNGSGVEAVLAGFGRVLDLRPEDTVLSTAKLPFGYGFGNSLLFPLATGAAVILNQGPPDVYRLAATIARHRPTVLCAVPRIYAALLDRARAATTPTAAATPTAAGTSTTAGTSTAAASPTVGQADGAGPPDLRSVRLAVSAGEHLPGALCDGFTRTFGVPLVNGLGATEVLHIVVATRGSRPGSTGTAVPGMTVSVRDDAGHPLPVGSEGRLHVAGPSVAAGYLDRPESQARTFADGGAYTGDIVAQQPDGELRYLCRHDDLINIGGYKVSPLDVEAAVRDLAGLAQCVVVGSRDQNGLEQAVAYLVPAPGADPVPLRQSARAAFRAGLPPFKRPAVVEVVEHLPTTSTGKLARYKLRAAGTAPAVVRMRVLRDGPGRTLVCIPYAGGSSGAFTRLARHLPGSWRVVAGEATYRDGVTIADAARAWWQAGTPYLSDGAVLFGHSLGAVLAAAVADAAGEGLAGTQVVLSAPPLLPGAERPALVSDDDETLLAGLRSTGLLPTSGLTSEEIIRLLLPRFRRDIALAPNGFEGVRTRAVHVLLGTDDGLCTREALAARIPVDRIASLHLITGDHYFVTTNPVQTAEVLAGMFQD
ncbi:AMP-binding protein [Plantactinospora soyae]|uniref:Acyl-coenzyme A synthetase/AMP-(Fatty) acid ligase/surfactin synthase thioesterase subunit n=1 Tax=Plantactinospora soyae TaxID=1544732 RepID=A0A927R1P8_9ACTN|nr:AMP-binding protein [Plantactinospora soyae]MBE1489958.1 acyl-coenzyme A synthetase/AMP-(fatty) acid ligase/surfactin synthase thioesterase subunit [Plantactinospora soyae]